VETIIKVGYFVLRKVAARREWKEKVERRVE